MAVDYVLNAGAEATSFTCKKGDTSDSWKTDDKKEHRIRGSLGDPDKTTDGTLRLTEAGVLKTSIPLYVNISNGGSYDSKTIHIRTYINGEFMSDTEHTYKPTGYKKMDTLSITNDIEDPAGPVDVSILVEFRTKANDRWYVSTVLLTVQCVPASYTITYRDPGSPDSPYMIPQVIDSKTYYRNVEFNLLSNVDVSYFGYKSKKWAIHTSDSSTTNKNFGDTYSLTKNVSADLIWEEAYTTLYLYNQGSFYNSIVVRQGQSTGSTGAGVPYRAGFIFDGWYTDTYGNGKIVYNSAGSAATSNGAWKWSGSSYIWMWNDETLYLYSSWYSYITYNTSYGTAPSSSIMTYYSTNTAASAPIDPTGEYKFLYWSGSDGNTYYPGNTIKSAYTEKANVTLTAVWRKEIGWITYNINGHGTAPDPNPQQMTYSNAAYVATMNDVLGYDFKGWATSSSGDVVYTDGTKIKDANTPPNSITLWAVWEKIAFFGRGKVNSEWKYGIVYFKRNGKWYLTPDGRVKVNGEWKMIE